MSKTYLPSILKQTKPTEQTDGKSASISALAPLLNSLPSSDFLKTFVTKFGAGSVASRFLRTSPDAASAGDALGVYLDWRKTEGLDVMRPCREEAMAHVGGAGVRMPLWVAPGGRLSYLDIGLVEKDGLDYKMLVRSMGILFEWLLYAEGCADEMEKSGGQIVAVGDFAGFSVRQADLKGLVAAVKAYMSYYPGCLKKVVIVNYPVAIQVLWKIVSPLLDEATRSSIIFLSDPTSLGETLTSILPENSVPEFLGGTLQTDETLSTSLTFATSATVATSSIHARFTTTAHGSDSSSSHILSPAASPTLKAAVNGNL